MIKEWKIFLTAVQFLTRIPIPPAIVHEPEHLRAAPRYFPVIGWIVAGFASLAYMLFSRYVSTNAGILASIIAGIFVTGAFHEDGFADVCDGMGGGWKREDILRIMKDSRIGAFGTIGMIAMLASKFVVLQELAPSHFFILATVCAHSISRMLPIWVMQFTDYATDPNQSKSKDITSLRLSAGALTLTCALSVAPFLFLPWPFLLTILPAIYATYGLNRYFKKWIGGYTGDCLGAIQQVTELLIYLGFVVVWRY